LGEPCAATGPTSSRVSQEEPLPRLTNGLIRRIEQRREGTGSLFTRRYKVHNLVWYLAFADVREAIQREKTMKEWPRAWKINLVEQTNPHWSDL
jgi:putative endonuclease